MGQITTTIRLNDDMSGALRRINRNIQAINQSAGRLNTGLRTAPINMNRLNSATSTVNRNMQSVSTTTRRIPPIINQTINGMNRFGISTNRARQSVRGLGSEVNSLLNKFAGVLTLKVAIDTADTITGAENKFNYINDYNAEKTQQTLDKLYSSALRARSSYAAAMDNTAKMMVNAGDAFDNNIDKASMFNELMEKSYVIGGASEQQRSSSMYQLIQGLGANTLQGDELRSVREGAMIAYDTIEKFAQKIYNTSKPLKDLASRGLITADIVANAMLDSADRINEAFSKSTMTIGQMWQNLKTKATKAFEPVFQQMSKLFNDPEFQAALDGIIYSFVYLSHIVLMVVSAIVKGFGWVTQALGGTKNVAMVLAVAFGMLAVTAMAAAIKAYLGWWMACWPIMLAVHLVLLLAMVFVKTSGKILGAVYVVGAAILNVLKFVGNIILGGIAFVAAIFVNFIFLMENLWAGLSSFMGALFSNLILFIANKIMSISEFTFNAVQFIKNILGGFGEFASALINNIAVAFLNGWDNIKIAGINMINSLLNAFVGLAEFLNKILGVFKINIDTSGVKNTISNLAGEKKRLKEDKLSYTDLSDAWNKGFSQNKNIDLGTLKYKNPVDAFKEDFGKFDYVNPFQQAKDAGSMFEYTSLKDAWKNGSETGTGYYNKLKDMLSDLDRKDEQFSWEELMKNAGLTPQDTNGSGNLANGLAGLGDTAKGIKGDTSKMADAQDLFNEEIKYLRDVAEQEVINRFTTAQVKINMNNNNNIHGNQDLDGIVTHLSNRLREELWVVADGVYR